jgi:mono/diheme cytochrome c family protein
MVGYGGAAPLFAPGVLPNRPRLPGRLLVFKIGGTATVAPYPTPEPVTIDLTGVTSSGDIAAGSKLYDNTCQACHGTDVSGRYLPDLKTSPTIKSQEEFKSVVIDGARRAKGMVGFSAYLTTEQAESIRAYILMEARKVPPAAPAGPAGG